MEESKGAQITIGKTIVKVIRCVIVDFAPCLSPTKPDVVVLGINHPKAGREAAGHPMSNISFNFRSCCNIETLSYSQKNRGCIDGCIMLVTKMDVVVLGINHPKAGREAAGHPISNISINFWSCCNIETLSYSQKNRGCIDGCIMLVSFLG
jgi:hypothetical protein